MKKTLFRRRRSFKKGTSGSVNVVWRKFNLTGWTPGTASVTDFWRYFNIQASSIPNFSEYAAVYDQYKILRMSYTLLPKYDNFGGDLTTNRPKNFISVIVDPKSTVTPSGAYIASTVNSFLEQGRSKTYNGNRKLVVTIKHPCTAVDVNGAANRAYGKMPWLNTSITDVPVRGCHVLMHDANLTGNFNQQYDVWCNVKIMYKGLK